MRNQPLTGFVLHQKPYGENRSLVYLFTQELGVVHGIGKKNLPLFLSIELIATGKQSLKTFSQSQISHFNQPLTGQGLFAGMYLNEVLLKLLPVEEPMADLWQAYQTSIATIAQLFQDTTPSVNDLTLLKWQLRQFETLLFEQLGYGLDFLVDGLGNQIQSEQTYRYQLQQGFVPILNSDKATISLTGKELIQWQQCLQQMQMFNKLLAEYPQTTQTLLNHIGSVYRMILDNLLNYQTLQSRVLWRQLSQNQ